MKATVVVICLAFGCMSVACSEESKSPATWANDWSAFVKDLSKEVAKDNYFVANVNKAFSGKRVEWTGTVKEIKRPQKDGDAGLIRLSMKPETLDLKSGKPSLDSIVLWPEGNEWNTWKTVGVGDVITFSTTLDEGILLPKCVLSKVDGMGPNAGNVLVWINTKRGSCLRIVEHSKK